MLKFQGYAISELLHDGKRSVVYRARRRQDDLPVVLKVLRGDHPSPDEVEGFKRQARVTQGLQLPCVVKTLDCETTDGRTVLVLEDFGGISLARYMNRQQVPLDEALTIAAALARCLAQVHGRGVVHRDINPANVIIDPETREPRLGDFGLALQHAPEQPLDQAVGTLLYMPPEQTGRLDRLVDQRSDLYSLGATLYHLLTGAPPFSSHDPMALIHHHLTRTPVPPLQLNPGIPPLLSELVLRLLAKPAEDRYQSARGLEADLLEIQGQLQRDETPDFPLGRRDISDRFQIPNRLYGRSQEQRTLTQAFRRVRRGSRELLLVAGGAGVGKSVLVRSVFGELVKAGGLFVSGKFEQFRRSVPYAPLLGALRQLVQRILASPEAELALHRERLLRSLGTNARLLCDVIPGLELITGDLAPLTDLPPAAARNRFHLTLLRFVGALAGAEHPLVLFLDDLQWADASTLDLVRLLGTDPDISHLLLVGVYRDEDSAAAQVLEVLSDEPAGGTALRRQEVLLQPLDRAHIEQLVADSIRCAPGRCKDLAQLVFQKTEGNPLFVTEFLHFLHQDGLLSFDPQTASWCWDLDRIQRTATTDNVVQLMVAKINRLPQEQRSLLVSAACIGTTFDPGTLSLVQGISRQRCVEKLEPLVHAGLVLAPVEPAPTGPEENPAAPYQFLHDRVQQVAYSLLSAEQQRRRHLSIGRLLRDGAGERLDERLFDVVHQLNRAKELITGDEERLELARLNLRAGDRARASSAHDSALGHLELGLELLGPSAWDGHHELAFALHLALAECAYFAGDTARAEQLFALLHEQAGSRLQQAEIYSCRLMLYDSGGEYLRNREVGLEALAMLGLTKLSGELTPAAVEAGFQRFFGLLGQRPLAALAELPEMTDPERRAMMELLAHMAAPAFITDPLFFALLSLEMICASVEHGTCEVSAFGFGALGILFTAMLDRPQEAEAAGDLGLALQARYGYLPLQCRIEFLMGCFILPWTRPLEQSLAMLRRAHLSGLQHGDLTYAGYASALRLRYLYTAGRPLQQIDEESDAFERFLTRLPGDYLMAANVMTKHARRALRGETTAPTRLGSDQFDEQQHIRLMERQRHGLDLFIYWSYRLQLATVHGHFDEARALALEHGDEVLHQGGMYDQLPYWLCRGLTCAALASGAGPGEPGGAREQRADLVADLEACIRKIEGWAAASPGNFSGHLLVLKAERARLDGDAWGALERLAEAERLARLSGSLWLEAVACELAGRLFLSRDLLTPARAHLLASRQAYRVWGGTAKVAQLDREFPQIMALVTGEGEPGSTESTAGSTTEHGTGSLDLRSVIKAGQVIAREIVLDRLLARLLEIAVENAGAERGALVLEEQGTLYIRAALEQADTDLTRHELPESERVIATVVNYVHRNQEPLVLEDARLDPRFCDDPILARRGVRSVLCVPLMSRGKLAGILYLENNLQARAFTARRLELLRLLSAQMASALENAREYLGVEAQVTRRTEELRQKNERLERAFRQLQTAQARLLQSKKMADLGQLAAGVSHEVNTPLGVLSSAADVIQRSVRRVSESLRGEWTLEQCREDRRFARALFALDSSSASITEAVQRIADITSGLASFAGIDQVELRQADVRAGIRNTLTLLGPQLGDRITLVTELAEVPELLCREGELNQVWMNLLKNALEASDDGGRVWVRARLQDQSVVVEVEDEGGGMAPELLDSLFDFQFSRGSRVHLGMGLKVSHTVVQKHGGTLTAANTDRGTLMTVRLPLTGLGGE